MELINLLTVTQPTVSKTRFHAQVYPALVQSSCSSASSPPLFPYCLIIGNKGIELEIQEQGLGHALFHPLDALYDLGQDLMFPQVSSPPHYDGKVRQKAQSLWVSPALHDSGPQAQAIGHPGGVSVQKQCDLRLDSCGTGTGQPPA